MAERYEFVTGYFYNPDDAEIERIKQVEMWSLNPTITVIDSMVQQFRDGMSYRWNVRLVLEEADETEAAPMRYNIWKRTHAGPIPTVASSTSSDTYDPRTGSTSYAETSEMPWWKIALPIVGGVVFVGGIGALLYYGGKSR